MGLINLKTNLKSLKYTNDRPAGGNSGQPFIQNPIIEEPGKLAQVDTDTILRGGLRAPLRAIEDVARMTKYLFNPKSPNGFLFIAKQNILSRTSVATEASINAAYGNAPTKELAWTKAALNQGIYTPLTTILQAGVNFSGTHLNLLGLNPFFPISGITNGKTISDTSSFESEIGVKAGLRGLSIIRYEDVVRSQTGLTKKKEIDTLVPNPDYVPYAPVSYGTPPPRTQRNEKFIPGKKIIRVPLGEYENRLLYLTANKQNVDSNDILFQYNGGPGSVLGIGKTTIKFADQRTGFNNSLYKSGIESPKWNWFLRGGIRLHQYSQNNIFRSQATKLNLLNNLGVSFAAGSTLKDLFIESYEDENGETGYDFNSGRFIGPHTSNFTLSTTSSISPRPAIEVKYGSIEKYQASGKPVNGRPPEINKFKFPTGSSISSFSSSLGIKEPINDNLVLITGSNSYELKLDLNYNYISGSNRQPKTDKFKPPIGSSKSAFSSSLGIKEPIQDTLETISGSNSYELKLDPNYNYKNNIRQPKTDKFKPPIGSSKSAFSSSLGIKEPINDNLVPISGSNSYTLTLNPNYRLKKDGKPLVDRNSSPKYKPPDKPIEERLYMGDVGSTRGSRSVPIDKINASLLYSSKVENSYGDLNDLIQLRFGAINPESPNEELVYAYFRAFLEDLSENYKGSWKGTNYMGRGEKFYKYQNFDRDVSFSFKVAALSQGEMENMYHKLNWLASLTAPYYTKEGYMSGNLIRLTIGGYLFEQPGFIESINYKISKDSPWNISRNEQNTIPELPMIIEVDVKFTPIHMFRPKLFDKDTKNEQYISATGPTSEYTFYKGNIANLKLPSTSNSTSTPSTSNSTSTPSTGSASSNSSNTLPSILAIPTSIANSITRFF